jgi:hypothetical protein
VCVEGKLHLPLLPAHHHVGDYHQRTNSGFDFQLGLEPGSPLSPTLIFLCANGIRSSPARPNHDTPVAPAGTFFGAPAIMFAAIGRFLVVIACPLSRVNPVAMRP